MGLIVQQDAYGNTGYIKPIQNNNFYLQPNPPSKIDAGFTRWQYPKPTGVRIQVVKQTIRALALNKTKGQLQKILELLADDISSMKIDGGSFRGDFTNYRMPEGSLGTGTEGRNSTATSDTSMMNMVPRTVDPVVNDLGSNILQLDLGARVTRAEAQLIRDALFQVYNELDAEHNPRANITEMDIDEAVDSVVDADPSIPTTPIIPNPTGVEFPRGLMPANRSRSFRENPQGTYGILDSSSESGRSTTSHGSAMSKYNLGNESGEGERTPRQMDFD